MVFSILITFSLKPSFFVQFFDQKGAFTQFSATVFPVLSVLIFFDLLQLVLSGALRGAANVRIVMWARLIICGLFFLPASYAVSLLPIHDESLRFILIYSTFYIGTGLMSLVFINRFRTGLWIEKSEFRKVKWQK
jgi:Na+-driven multidrug efflux pump